MEKFMNSIQSAPQAPLDKCSFILDRPYVDPFDGLYGNAKSPNPFLIVVKNLTGVLQKIGRIIMQIVSRIKHSLREGADIHNRQVQSIDERYARNWFHIRRGLS